VRDRDYCMELANAIAICIPRMSRLSEEVVLWCSWEFRFVELDDAYSTGSSIMPQKKNPDICELIRGKTGRTVGNLTTLLSMMKGLPLAYNKDMQEDKEAIFDSVDTVKLCLSTLAPMLDTMKVNKENMANAGKKGFINATDCADYLVKKGLPFRDAYKITGTLVALCIDRGVTLDTLPIDEYKKLSDKFQEDVYDAISLENCVKGRNVVGGPAPEAVASHIEKIKNTVLKEEDDED
ncbi:MAG: argininosuccinate lyase, partial [Clostridia bacterium]|nr:argininosuccinate lyase [Clostridia bacterium]